MVKVPSSYLAREFVVNGSFWANSKPSDRSKPFTVKVLDVDEKGKSKADIRFKIGFKTQSSPAPRLWRAKTGGGSASMPFHSFKSTFALLRL